MSTPTVFVSNDEWFMLSNRFNNEIDHNFDILKKIRMGELQEKQVTVLSIY